MTRCNSCRMDVEPVVARCRTGVGQDLRLCPRCGGALARTFTLAERGRGKALGHRVGIYAPPRGGTP